MLQVHDGSRILQFDGKLLAHSTSWRRGSYRWVEFKLYRTDSGTYVISRIGESLLYHMPDCEIVARNKIREEPRSGLDRDAHPCDICHPERQPTFPLVCPEMPRYRAQVCDGPGAVLDSLHRYDAAGSRYLTLVAERLLNQAAEQDHDIAQAFRVETIQ
jgi:hypothetical protein